ncbi:MAG: hypothetical protein QM831_33750 [Kofleriaceae bacterium]
MTKSLLLFIAASTGCGDSLSGPIDLLPTATFDPPTETQPTADAPAFSGSVFDERNDILDVSTGELVHRHVGPKTVLGDGCPDVYMYSYAGMQENEPNPLTFDFNASVAAYRVVDIFGATIVDWTDATSDSITLDKDAMPSREMYLQIRQPSGGSASTCWHQHRLDAPLVTEQPQRGALFGMTFASKADLAPLVNHGDGVEVARLPFAQYLDQPITFSMSAPTPAGKTTADLARVTIADDVENALYQCDPENCRVVSFDDHVRTEAPTSGTWAVTVIDDTTGETICRADGTRIECPIAARIDEPHKYHASLTLAGEPTLAPARAAEFAEFPQATQSLLGVRIGDDRTGCTKPVGLETNGVWCFETTQFTPLAIVNEGEIAFEAIRLQIGATTRTVEAATWNSGNAGY